MSNSFSFLNETAIISYDEGVRQNRDKISSKIKNKMTTGKRLTDTENVFVKGLAEIKDESELSKEERLAWLKTEDN